MHWAVIIGMAVPACISAYLVMESGWAPATALLTAGLGTLALISTLLGLLMIFQSAEARRQTLREVLQTMRGDLRDLLQWLGLK